MSRRDQQNSLEGQRRRWMGVLARADRATLEQAWAALPMRPDYRHLRPPESGLIMVRARAGGCGQPFNLGEMTVARCSVQLDDGTMGHGYATGRDLRKVELAALFDAMLQTAGGPDIERRVMEPIADAMRRAREETGRKAAATRVDFFGLARGQST